MANPINIATGIGAATDLASNVASGIFGAIHARKQRQFARKRWRKENAYNHPAAQIARMKEAGLNPMLFYGQGSHGGGTAAPAPEYSKPEGVNFKLDPQQLMMQHLAMKSTEVQTQNQKKAGLLLDEQINQAKANIVSTLISNRGKRLVNKRTKETLQTTIDTELAELNNRAVQAAMQTGKTIRDEEARMKNPEREELERQIKTKLQKAQLRGVRLDNKLKAFEKRLNDMDMTKSDPLTDRTLRPILRKLFGENGEGLASILAGLTKTAAIDKLSDLLGLK